jgi:hypothetical protein
MVARLQKRVGRVSVIVAAAGLIVAGSIAGPACAQKPLPAEIPRAKPAFAEIVHEVVQVAKQVEDPKECYNRLATTFWLIHTLPRHETEPIVKLLEETVTRIDDERFLFGTRQSLIAAAPEWAILTAARLKDPAARDHYLADVARALARTDPKRARELIGQMKTPSYRAQAMAGLARIAKLDYRETTELLAGVVQAAGSDWNPLAYALPYEYADSLGRFAADRPQEVADFVTRHLKPNDAAWCFLRIAGEGKAPKATPMMLDRAAATLPNARDPGELVPLLIHTGYGKLHPKEALELFDRYTMPKLREKPGSFDYYLASLAAIDVDLMVKRAQRYAEETTPPETDDYSFSRTEIVARVIGQAAADVGAEPVLAWLKKAPPGPIRDESIPFIALYVALAPSEPDPNSGASETPRETFRNHFQTLADAARAIADPKAKWRAYSDILVYAEGANIPGAAQMREEYRRLWYQVKDKLDERDRMDIRIGPFGALPEEAQREHIRQFLKADAGHDRFSVAAQLLRKSTLPAEERRKFYRVFIEEAHGDAVALSCLAQSIAPLDFPWALKLIWSVLPDVRKRESTPYYLPPHNAEEALTCILCECNSTSPPGSVPCGETLSKPDLPQVLWSFAKTVPEVDRDGVLREIGRVLVRRHRLDEAFGVARLIEDRRKRMELLSEIAADLAEHRAKN